MYHEDTSFCSLVLSLGETNGVLFAADASGFGSAVLVTGCGFPRMDSYHATKETAESVDACALCCCRRAEEFLRFVWSPGYRADGLFFVFATRIF